MIVPFRDQVALLIGDISSLGYACTKALAAEIAGMVMTITARRYPPKRWPQR
ncbi:hypothetical protein [Erwinia sp. MYb416]|uniref:hypothetical protein n=1 Tax=Erwinia sp. MYb416 TaxID=3108532 RepID=UPI0030A8E309